MSSDKLIRILKSLPSFAKNFLIIHDKSGAELPLTFNRAQQYIHDRLEAQREATGKVRALICKGRQQGCCFSEQMRVLSSTYEWVKIKDIQVGDNLFALDEEPKSVNVNGRKTDRKIQLATVEAKVSFKKEAFEVCLSNGVKLKVTGDHRMLFKQRGGCLSLWRKIEDSIVGDCIRSFSCPPPDCAPSYEDGWFGGLLDGEGSFGCYPAARIAISQVDGLVLDRCKKYLTDRGIKYYELIDRRKSGITSKYGDKEVHCIRIDRQADIIKILALTQPSRFINRPEFVGKSLPNSCDGFDAWVKIKSIRSIGVIDVIDLQTSTKTFICEGLVSHNSTYVQARFFHKIVTKKGKKAFILTHLSDATRAIFEMTKRYSENLDKDLFAQPDKKNDNTLMYDRLGSGYRVGTAGSAEIGRSMTNQYLHLSEYAFYKDAARIGLGLLQTVAEMADTVVIKESTANGIDNDFYQEWQAAKNGSSRYQAIFVPWYWQDEYCIDDANFILHDDEREWLEQFKSNGLKLGHLNWRRIKLQDFKGDYDQKCRKFRQEYPFTDDEAFLSSITDTFINVECVQRARKVKVESKSNLVIGIDPARKGDDRTAIIRRRGRRAYNLETHYNIDTMELVGIIRRIIDKEEPKRVCIDSIGIGAGVVDRLIELGYSIVEGVNVARKASEPDKYKNLRAELWDMMREWLIQDMPIEIPDSDELQTDLTNLGYKYDSSDRLQIESKDDAKKRGLLSPDTSDSLMLTFFGGEYVGEGGYQANRLPDRFDGMLI